VSILRRYVNGPPGQEYSTVWSLRIPGTTLSVRLHHWYGSDDTRAHHSHPQWFRTLVLWGAYDDYSPESRNENGFLRNCPRCEGTGVDLHLDREDGYPARSACGHRCWEPDHVGWGQSRLRAADYRHYVVPTTKHVWTLLLFGGPRQRWDFYEKGTGRRMRRDRWFAEMGHHTQDGSPAVRLRPDGSRI
jgi:hypothetical protein